MTDKVEKEKPEEEQKSEEIAASPPTDKHNEEISPQDTEPSQVSNLSDAAKLPLSIELARKVMPLKEIGELKTGQVIELGKKADDPVNLILSGRGIGKGQLVDVDGKLGVKILSIVGP